MEGSGVDVPVRQVRRAGRELLRNAVDEAPKSRRRISSKMAGVIASD